jgi:tetratricopeptide (TPR) repeat protein
MVNRHAETKLLGDMLAEAQRGSGSTVLIVGPGGIGKTAILRWLEGEANSRKLKVRWGCCLPEIQEPFFVMEELFRAGGAEPPGRGGRTPLRMMPKAFIPPSARGSGYDGMPVAFVPMGARLEEERSSTDRAPTNVLLDYLSLMEEESRAGPCVLLLDDFHWADPDSVQALIFLSRNIRRMPVLLAVTLREDEEQSPELRLALKDLRKDGQTKETVLKGLDEKDSQKLLENAVHARLKGGRENNALRLLLDQTGGNPYFFLELAQMWRDTGLIRVEGGRVVTDARIDRGFDHAQITMPGSVLALLTERIDSLSKGDRDILGAASILGQEFEVPALEELFPVRVESVAKALIRLSSRRGLVVPKDQNGTRYAFSAALLWEAVRNSVPEDKRKQWADQLAKWMEVHLPADIVRISMLYRWGKMNAKALPYVDRVIEMSLQLHAHERVTTYFEKRLAIMEEDGSSPAEMAGWGLAVIDNLIRDGGNARRIEPMCNRLLKMDLPEPFSWELMVRLANAIDWERPKEARKLLQEVDTVVREGPQGPSQALRGRIALADCRVLYYEGKLDGCVEAGNLALSLLPEDERYFRGLTYFWMGWVSNDRNQWDEAARCLENGLSIAREGKQLGLIHQVLNLKGAIAYAKGALREAEESFLEGSEVCRELGHAGNLTVFLVNLSTARQQIGDLDGAEKDAREALRLAQAFGLSFVQGIAHQTLGDVMKRRRLSSEALELFSKAKRVFEETGNAEQIQDLDLDIAEVRAMMGDASGALGLLKKLTEQGELKQDQLARFHMLKSRLALATGSSEEAKAEAELALSESRKRGLRYWEGRALLGLSEWEREFGTVEMADKGREEAEKVLKECGVANMSPILDSLTPN